MAVARLMYRARNKTRSSNNRPARPICCSYNSASPVRLLQLITLDDSVFAIVITAAEQVVFTVFTRICLLAGLLKVKVTRGQEVKIVFCECLRSKLS